MEPRIIRMIEDADSRACTHGKGSQAKPRATGGIIWADDIGGSSSHDQNNFMNSFSLLPVISFIAARCTIYTCCPLLRYEYGIKFKPASFNLQLTIFIAEIVLLPYYIAVYHSRFLRADALKTGIFGLHFRPPVIFLITFTFKLISHIKYVYKCLFLRRHLGGNARNHEEISCSTSFKRDINPLSRPSPGRLHFTHPRLQFRVPKHILHFCLLPPKPLKKEQVIVFRRVQAETPGIVAK